jgi:hypothetical protein
MNQVKTWAYVLGAVVMTATTTRADFPIAENGQPKCVVLAGAQFANQAKHLTAYLEQITGAKSPVVADAAAANGQPVIILEKVDKVPGSSAKVTARQAYRIKVDDKMLRLTGGSRTISAAGSTRSRAIASRTSRLSRRNRHWRWAGWTIFRSRRSCSEVSSGGRAPTAGW